MKANKKQRTSKKKHSKIAGLRKYRSIIISVILFLLFDISILALNYYQSFQVSRSAIEINLASRQAGLAEDIAKDITDINLIAERDYNVGGYINTVELKKDVYKQFDALQQSTRLFSQTLNALREGGSIDGLDVNISAIDIPSAVHSLDTINRIWVPYQGLLDSFIHDYEQDDTTLDTIQFATDYARIYTRRLLIESDSIAATLQEKAEYQADILKMIQIIGILIAVTIFFFIVFRALRALLNSDIELEKSQRETEEIMDTIQEGLFLIDRDCVVGEQQSSQLKHILPIRDIAGKKFDEILEGIIPKKSVVNTRRFITQLFNRKVRENLINDLNPLRRVLVQHQQEDGSYRQNYLSFHFVRSYQGKHIRHVLVSITDITNAVELEMRLQKEREQTEVQFEMLMKLLRIEPRTLDKFMQNATEMSNRINEILRKGGRSQGELKNKVNDIFREVHSFKGEASALELDGFVDIAETMENHLKTLREKHSLSGNDFLNTTMTLDQFFNLNQDIQNMRNRLVNLNLNHQDSKPADAGLSQHLSHFAEQIATRNGKQVSIDIQGFDELTLDEQTTDKVKEIVIQLLRNAIVHGIEDPQTRVEQGKTETGHIRLALSQENDTCRILVEDDGGGIRKDAIRNKLIAAGHYTPEQAAQLSGHELYRAIFMSGLSTQDESSEDAGRGVGMDVVKDRIRQIHGKINIRSDEGRYSRFVIQFPTAM